MCLALHLLLHHLYVARRRVARCQPCRPIFGQSVADTLSIVFAHCLERCTQSLLMIFSLLRRCLLLMLSLSIAISYLSYLVIQFFKLPLFSILQINRILVLLCYRRHLTPALLYELLEAYLFLFSMFTSNFLPTEITHRFRCDTRKFLQTILSFSQSSIAVPLFIVQTTLVSLCDGTC